MGVRKRLLAAFNQASSGSSEGAAPAQTSGSSPAEATKESPFITSLGMPFVPIPRFETRFCIWPVRVQDYERYCAATGATYPPCPFPQGSDHPVVGVTWDDAIAFCVWLTDKEQAEGKIDEKTVYRLPTDIEWSAAVGLPHEPEPTPEERHLKAPGYPWGFRWPPPENAGNYEHYRKTDYTPINSYRDEIANPLREKWASWEKKWSPVDKYEFTSPVNAFSPNSNGIYDLGGNVWEWCLDTLVNPSTQNHKLMILRGGSFSECPYSGFSGKNEWGFYWYPDDKPHKQLSHKTLLPLENIDVYRSSYRHLEYCSYSRPEIGFRIVRATKQIRKPITKIRKKITLEKNDPCICGSGEKPENCCWKGAKENQKSPSSHVISSSENPGRNHPCPCGSGHKFKNCCQK